MKIQIVDPPLIRVWESTTPPPSSYTPPPRIQPLSNEEFNQTNPLLPNRP